MMMQTAIYPMTERVLLRRLRADDGERLYEMQQRTSPNSLYQRYNGAHVPSRKALERLCTDGCGVVAVHGLAIVGIAYFVATDEATAEAAFLVEDSYQNQGIGTRLCQRLIELARAQRLQRLVAIVRAGNRPMLRVLAKMQLPDRQTIAYGTRTVVLQLDGRADFPRRGWDHWPDVLSV